MPEQTSLLNSAEIAAIESEKQAEQLQEDVAKGKKARASKAAEGVKNKDGYIVYTSAHEEPVAFHLFLDPSLPAIRGVHDAERAFVIWRVPAELAERLDRTHFIKTGRIIRAED